LNVADLPAKRQRVILHHAVDETERSRRSGVDDVAEKVELPCLCRVDQPRQTPRPAKIAGVADPRKAGSIACRAAGNGESHAMARPGHPMAGPFIMAMTIVQIVRRSSGSSCERSAGRHTERRRQYQGQAASRSRALGAQTRSPEVDLGGRTVIARRVGAIIGRGIIVVGRRRIGRGRDCRTGDGANCYTSRDAGAAVVGTSAIN